MKIKACIFDLDGVLTDTADQHFNSWSKIAAKFGLALTAEHNEQLKGVSRPDSLKKILRWSGSEVDQDTFQSLLLTKNEHYLEGISKLSTSDILPGVVQFLDDLSNNSIEIAVGSSSRNAPLILKRLNLFDRFKVISDGNSVQHTKPAPDVFLHAASKLNIDPQNCVVFEDAESGVEAALSANMKVVGVGPAHQLKNATFCVDSMTELNFNILQQNLA